ncbi:MAG: helix-turn-helix domain-containing protein [Pseudomonadota bacterium]
MNMKGRRDAPDAGGDMLAAIVSITAAFAMSRGMSLSELETLAGHAVAQLADPDARVPDTVVGKIWVELEAREPGVPLTLAMAQAAPYSVFGGLTQGMQFAGSLREALRFFAQNQMIMADRLQISLMESGDEARLEASHPAEVLDKGRAGEVAIAMVARFIGEVLQLRDCIARVHYASSPMGSVSAYEEFFGAPVLFNEAGNSVVFHRNRLDDTPSHRNLELFAFVAEVFDQRKKQIGSSAAATDRERLDLAIAESVAARQFSAQSIAGHAQMSVRSAQRVAKAYGTSLTKLMHEARIGASKELLKDGRFGVEAVAAHLGYSDGRAFRRAFKREIGLTPSEFRLSNSRFQR